MIDDVAGRRVLVADDVMLHRFVRGEGADYIVETVVGADLVLGSGGWVEMVTLAPDDQSSTRLIARSCAEAAPSG